MHISQHAAQRMSQRGISRRLVDFALRYGRVEGDKHVLDRNESRRLIEALNEELPLAKRVMDKGGITVVAGGDTLVTTYNVGTYARPHRTAQASPRHELMSPGPVATVPAPLQGP
jgi:hypothetical protein